MPARKTTTKKTTAKKPIAKKATARTTAAKKSTKKATVTARKTAAKKSTAGARKTGARETTTTATARRRGSRPLQARRGDLIVVDSSAVGSPPREGEVLRVIRGDVSVSYRVRWTDGHESLISPAAGTVSVVRS